MLNEQLAPPLPRRLSGARQTAWQRWAVMALSLLCAVAIVGHFYARFWWPPDEGVYAYVAQRLLAGDRLNGEIQDIHFGLVHFVHAAALWLFGDDLLSLRYPLAVLTVIQSGLGCFLLARRNLAAAFAAALALAALTFVQFLNPTANWYALFTAVIAMVLVADGPKDAQWRNVSLGAVIALAFAFRQLSGVFIGIGAIAWLLAENRGPQDRAVLARCVIALLLVVMLGYLVLQASPIGILLFGIGPIMMLLAALRRASLDSRATLRLLLQLALGAAPVLLPVVAYHALNGTLVSWLRDVIVVAPSLPQLAFFSQASYVALAALSALAILQASSFAAVASGVFWLLLLVLPLTLSLVALRRCRFGQPGAPWDGPSLVALCVAPVAAFYEIHVYLMHAIAPVVVGWLWLQSDRAVVGRWQPAVAALLVLFLSLTGLFWHAGQPVQRGLAGIANGVTVSLDAGDGIEGARIAMSRVDRDSYTAIMAFIGAHARPCDTVLALPMHPQINFLSHRRAPFRFFSSALGLQTDGDVQDAQAVLLRAPPAVIFWLPDDKYNTPRELQLVGWIQAHYASAGRIGEFSVFVPLASASAGACP